MLTHKNTTNRARGFTIVELAVVMVILVIVLGTTFRLTMTLKRGATATSRGVEAQTAATTALESIVDALQTASSRGLDPANNFTGYTGTAFLFRGPQRDGAGDYTVVNGQVTLQVLRTQLVAVGTSLMLQQVDAVGNPVAIPAPVVLCQNLAVDEDANGNGVLDGGEDLDGDGLLQRGVLFVVSNEDGNGNGILDPGEDANQNGRLDCTLVVSVDTLVRDPRGPDHGRTTMTTQVLLRNS